MKTALQFTCAAFLLSWSGTAFAQTYDQSGALKTGPGNYTSTDIGGTVTTGGSYQTVAAANQSRRNCTVQNPGNATEVLDVKIGTMAQPYVLNAGQGISSNSVGVDATDAITVTAATTGHAFAGTCQ